MMRLLSAEGYKLRRSKSFYICMLVLVLITCLMYGLLAAEDTILKGKMENGSGSVAVARENEKAEDGSPVLEVLQEIFSGDIMACILSVFISIFVVGEFGSGMVKNIVGKGCTRGEIYLSKLAVTILGVVIIILVSVGAVLLGGLMFFGKDAFGGDFWKNAVTFTGLQIMLEIALTAVFMLAGECSRNFAAGISLGIGVAAFPSILLGSLDILWADKGFTPSKYWLVSRTASCPTDGFTAGFIKETALVSVIWLVLAAGLGILHFYKADIK